MRLATAFDGQFYPSRAEELAATADACLAGGVQVSGRVLGLVVPHAGYVYSGATAGTAIALLAQDPPEAVVVLGPSHRVYFEGIRVFDLEGYETPLGPIPGDPDLARAIARGLGGDALVQGFPEHSVEVQLPLLSRVLPGIPVVQIVFGVTRTGEAERLAEVLLEQGERESIAVVASSDLSHYHDRDRARILDGCFRRLLEAGDPQGMRMALDKGETEACGSGPVLTLMEMARRAGARIETLQQTDSSEASGDTTQVVGYLSAAVLVGGDRG